MFLFNHIQIRYELKLFSLFVLIILIVSTESEENIKRTKINVKSIRKSKKYEGMLHLVNGNGSHQGNVEIFHKGEWGNICDDEWDIREAAVACYQLGYPGVLRPTHSSMFGKPKFKYWMDNLYCSGKEAQLLECRFDGWGKNDCASDEAAGVVCKSDQPLKTTPVPSVNTSKKIQIKNKMEIRLIGGRAKDEGRVEVKLSNSDWGSVCGDGWSLLEAGVVCKQLNFGYALAATQTNHFSGKLSKMLVSGIECRGNETKLVECQMHHYTQTKCPGTSNEVAGVICVREMADLVMDAGELMRSAYLEDKQLYLLQCAMEENCLASSAYEIAGTVDENWHLETRRLLRFTARILNAGTSDFRPALPKHLWEFHQCHMHYHSMEVFATFDVMAGNKKVAEGHKASFCLEDNQCLPGTKPRFACANYGDQGISINCSDIYKHNIDCQWVDISDLSPGLYTLKIAINPEFKVPEMSYENNAAICQMNYTPYGVLITDCYLTRP